MTHEITFVELSALHDHEGSGPAIAAHVGACAECQAVLRAFTAAGRAAVLPHRPHVRSRSARVALLVLVALTLTAAVAVAAGPLRLTRFVTEPLTPVRTSIGSVNFDVLPLTEVRTRTGLPLPLETQRVGEWTLTRADYAAALGQQLILTYVRGDARLTAWVQPLRFRPAIPVAGLAMETVNVAGQPVVLVYGANGPGVAPGPGDRVDAAALAHQLSAVLEDDSLSLRLVVDDRETDRKALIAFVASWLGAAR